MQNHHIGSGRRRVIPAGWSDHHRPVLATTRDAMVTLGRPRTVKSDFDRDTGKWTVESVGVFYTGPARVQILAATPDAQESADQEVSTVRYAVMLDHTIAGVQLEDLCTVVTVDDNGDADMAGRVLLVESIERGSLQWERRLICTDNLETQEAG